MSDTPNTNATHHTPPPARRRRSSTAGVVTAIIGGVLLVAAVGTIVLNSVLTSRDGTPGVQTISAAESRGVSAVHTDIGAATFTLEFADVDEVTLDVSEGAERDWVLERRGDTIVVDSQRGFFGVCLFGCGWSNDVATLTLPQSLEGVVDAHLSLGSGSIHAAGDFRILDLDVSAGDLTVEGSARLVTTDVSAGHAEVDIAGVREAEFEVSAGKIDAHLSGDAPDRIAIDVAAGAVDLTVPDATYRVESDVAAGSLDHTLRTDPASPHSIVVDVSAGEARISTR